MILSVCLLALACGFAIIYGVKVLYIQDRMQTFRDVIACQSCTHDMGHATTWDAFTVVAWQNTSGYCIWCGKYNDNLESTREFELILPTWLAIELDNLSVILQISRGETVSRALRLLAKAVEADKVTLTKDNKTTSVLIK